MKYINYESNSLKLKFAVKPDKSISLIYFGSKDFNWLKKGGDDNLYSFVEAQINGEDQNAHHGCKIIRTSYAVSKKYVSSSLNNNELIIVTSNGKLEVETHYKFHDNISSFSIWNNAKNISKTPISLENLSSFYLSGFGQKSGRITDKFNFWHATNSWHSESQWVKDSFEHLGIFPGNDYLSVKRYSISNTGIWSTKDFLPMGIIENSKAKRTLVCQIENNGSWHIEVSDNGGALYASFSGPTFLDNAWLKTLKPGESFEGVKATVALSTDFEGAIQEITKARRAIKEKSEDNEKMPIIFNDYMHALWDTQTTDLILPLVDAAASVGSDEFCMDAGWFALGKDWWPILGCWDVYEDNFPGGFDKVIKYIKSKGMKPGIWFEIEAMGINCPLASKLPDEYFFMLNGKREIHHSRYQLNFANPEVYKMCMDAVCKIVDKYDIEYIKNDCNTDGWVGNEVDSDSLGDGLLKHNRAFIKFIRELKAKYPNITIENCGSGGCRMDYELLKCCDVQSTSDQTDYRKYPYLASACLTAVIPEQEGVWAYPVNAYTEETPTDEIVAMNMVNSMLGRIHLASYLNKLTKEQIELVKEGIAYYRSIVDFKKRSVPVYPNGIPYFYDKNVACGLKHGNKIVLCVWNTSGKPSKINVNLKKYNASKVKVVYPLKFNTQFSFDNEKQKLVFDAKEGYMGRVFEVECK